jgi:hypothetical protein
VKEKEIKESKVFFDVVYEFFLSGSPSQSTWGGVEASTN